MTPGASSSSLTPLTLQAVAAVALAALAVVLLGGMLYLLLAGSVAWALMVLQGLLWLAFQGARRSWHVVRRHVRRATPEIAEAAADLVLRPSH